MLVVSMCDDCKIGCDASRMEFLLEVFTPRGETFILAPANNARLDNRMLRFDGDSVGIPNPEITVKNIILTCEDCAAKREVLRSTA